LKGILSSLLAPIVGSEDRSWLTHSATAHGNGPILEDDFLAHEGKHVSNGLNQRN
jgi:hypothetical protein